MANGRRRPIAPVRKIVAAVLGTFAAFVILFGAGMTSWAIVALGAALLILAIGLVVVSAVRGSGARAWVAGTAHVVSASEPPASSAYGRCELQIVIDAPGLPAAAIKIRDPRVPVTKWPDAGATLPVLVAIDDMRHVRIQWDDVLTHQEAATSRAERPVDSADGDAELLTDDDMLIGKDEPPWSRRGPDDDFLSPGDAEPVTADLTDELGGLHDEPVVVHRTPGGPIVLEGSLVGTPSTVPLPRRAKPSPRPRTDEPGPAGGAGAEAASGPTGGAGATPAPAAGTTPSAGAGTVLADPPATESEGDSRFVHQADPTAAAGTSAGGSDHGAVAADEGDELFTDLIPTEPGAPGPPGTIHGVGITLLVTDLERSIAFYRDMLGFFEIDGGDGSAVLAAGNTRLVLRAIPEVAPINRRLVHVNLEVADVEAMYDQLKAKGVRFTYAPRAVNRGNKLELWAAAFRDPDGHGIALSQWRNREED